MGHRPSDAKWKNLTGEWEMLTSFISTELPGPSMEPQRCSDKYGGRTLKLKVHTVVRKIPGMCVSVPGKTYPRWQLKDNRRNHATTCSTQKTTFALAPHLAHANAKIRNKCCTAG